jgi:hypothetical protein
MKPRQPHRSPLRPRAKPRRDTGGTVTVFILVFAVTVVGVGITPRLFQPRALPAYDAAADANIRTGTIVVRLSNTKCRQMAFDNTTGKFHDAAVSPCEDLMTQYRYGLGGDNIHTVRDSFNRR